MNVSKYGEEFAAIRGGSSRQMTSPRFWWRMDWGMGTMQAWHRSKPFASCGIIGNCRPGPLVDLAHQALRSLRGAAVAVARFDLAQE